MNANGLWDYIEFIENTYSIVKYSNNSKKRVRPKKNGIENGKKNSFHGYVYFPILFQSRTLIWWYLELIQILIIWNQSK